MGDGEVSDLVKRLHDHAMLFTSGGTMRESKFLMEEAEVRIDELERALASKIGPDWREALPYESELELREVVEDERRRFRDYRKVVDPEITALSKALKRLRDLVEFGQTPCPFLAPPLTTTGTHSITGEEATNAVIEADAVLTGARLVFGARRHGDILTFEQEGISSAPKGTDTQSE